MKAKNPTKIKQMMLEKFGATNNPERADALGIGMRTVSQILNEHNVRAGTALKVANKLEVGVGDLFKFVD